MTTCAPFGASGPAGISDALHKVDCLAAEATNFSFGRLFGENGSLQTALTILLTLYIALLAVNLLTGRSALRLSVLTPKMMTLGLVLTFVTSWIAYQSVVWNLAVGAPDEIASVLAGSEGSATTLFAQRLDMFFNAITGAADSAAAAAAANPAHAAAASSAIASPASILTFAALLLLLGTVGVLVVCRLALAALLILGPVFIVLALFEGTRGLFEGWLKSVAMFALVPLLTVLIGSGAVVAISPMVAGLSVVGGEIPLRAAVSILVASVVYVALMLVTLKVATSLTRGWRIGKTVPQAARSDTVVQAQGGSGPGHVAQSGGTATMVSERVRTAVASLENRVSTTRLAHLHGSALPAGHGALDMREMITSPARAKHGSYFNHRTQRIASDIPREMIR